MSTHPQTAETLLFFVLCQIVVMIGAARLCNGLARRLGQPGAVGEILAGLALGPSLFGHVFPATSASIFVPPASQINAILSQIGLVLLMFQIGTQFEFRQLSSALYRKVTASVALASIAAPLALGLAFGLLSAASLAPGIDRVAYSLFCSVAVAITAVPILGRILQEFGLNRHPIGIITITAAAINDVVGWLLLACISAYAASRFSLLDLLWRSAALLLGGIFLWWAMRPAVGWLLRRQPIVAGSIPPNLTAIVLCLIFVLGLFTSSIGIFTIFGGFAAGLLFHTHEDFVDAWRIQTGQFVLVFFLPIFFTFTGLRTNLLGLSTPADFAWLALVLVISVLGKIVPVYLAARLAGLPHWPAALIGTLMNTRALMELIVLNVGYSSGVLPQKVFTMLVVMAVLTTLMTGPLLRLLLPRAGFAHTRQIEA